MTAAVETEKLAREKIKNKTAVDYFSLVLTTFGVGYIPLAPGTLGSAVGVLIYLVFRQSETRVISELVRQNLQTDALTAWVYAINSVLLLMFCLIGIWAANRTTEFFQNKDPQKVVVDEVMGQLITFLFVPFGVSWHFVLAGFLLFRLFDIWKPYPIRSLENLPTGVGICADDILAGVYAGICLSVFYAVRISI